MGAALVRIVKRVPSVAVGGVLTAVTMLAWGELYQPVPMPVSEIAADGRASTEPVPECSSVYPNLRVCSQLPHRYMYGSKNEALSALKRETGNAGLSTRNPSASTSGPCPGVGHHYNVRQPGSGPDYPASIVCCPCCDDDEFGAPAEDLMCGIVPKNSGCDTRRRASDANCEE